MRMNKDADSGDELRRAARRDRRSGIARCPAACSRSPNSCSIIRPTSRSARSPRSRSARACRRRPIVRFAHALGFGGFTQMQQVFRSRLVAGVAPSYKARLARMKDEEKSILGRKPAAVFGRFIARGAIVAGDAEPIGARARSGSGDRDPGKARDIYLLGLGGSFPVATHLAYVLRKLGRRVVLLDGIGGSIQEQSHPASAEDALIAISFRNYYPDTARAVPRTCGAARACDLHHRQRAEPDRRGRERSCSRSRTCRSRRCARWSRRCAWSRRSPSASISRQNRRLHIQEQDTMALSTTPRATLDGQGCAGHRRRARAWPRVRRTAREPRRRCRDPRHARERAGGIWRRHRR